MNCCLKLFNFVQNVQTGLTDTTVNKTVALIARSLEYVTGKQDIATVKWGGNQIHVTRVRHKSVKTLSVSFFFILKNRKEHRMFNINQINVTCLTLLTRQFTTLQFNISTNKQLFFYTHGLCQCSYPSMINFSYRSCLSFLFK